MIGLARVLADIPALQLSTPEDVASAVAYLVSDAAGYVNGTIVDVGGGGFMP